MTVVALASARGAPGVTTTALALTWAWPVAQPGRRVLLVDADPAGSGLLTGPLRAGVPDSVGVSLLAAARGPLTAESVVSAAVALDEESTRMALPGVADPMQARPLASTWLALADAAHDLGAGSIDVVVDTGRVGHRYEPTAWLTEADVLALVVRTDLSTVLPAAAAVRTLTELRTGRPGPIGLAVDPAGYSTAEIAAGLGVREVLTVARDEWAARALGAGVARGLRFGRSPLMRSARAVVDRLAELVPDPDWMAQP